MKVGHGGQLEQKMDQMDNEYFYHFFKTISTKVESLSLDRLISELESFEIKESDICRSAIEEGACNAEKRRIIHLEKMNNFFGAVTPTVIIDYICIPGEIPNIQSCMFFTGGCHYILLRGDGYTGTFPKAEIDMVGEEFWAEFGSKPGERLDNLIKMFPEVTFLVGEIGPHAKNRLSTWSRDQGYDLGKYCSSVMTVGFAEDF